MYESCLGKLPIENQQTFTVRGKGVLTAMGIETLTIHLLSSVNTEKTKQNKTKLTPPFDVKQENTNPPPLMEKQ